MCLYWKAAECVIVPSCEAHVWLVSFWVWCLWRTLVGTDTYYVTGIRCISDILILS